MSIRLVRFVFQALLCIVGSTAIVAQSAPAQPAPGKFTLFFEKVYLHLDRSYYAAGEDLWFKAYLVNGQTNYLVNTSNNLYVELITPGNQVMAREVIRLNNGEGNGDFRLQDSIPAGRYRVRAYTNWMRNFGNMFVFEKEIRISSPLPAPETNTKRQPVQQAGKSEVVQAKAGDSRILFFPESGSLLTGVTSLVAFKAEDAAGKGLPAKGTIVSSKGQVVATFQTEHAGMGSFSLKPEPGVTYEAKGTYTNGRSFATALPSAIAEGLALQVTAADTFFTAVVQTNAATLASAGARVVTIGGKHGGKFFFEDTITLSRETAALRIPKRLFPNGIASITLYDEKLRPHAERLVYVDQPSGIALTLRTNKAEYATGENVSLSIEAKDSEGYAIPAHVSVTAVDAGVVPEAAEDIVTYLLLQSEVRGNIEQPVTYFDQKNKNRLAWLDLLLRTQGWRDFIWRRVKDTAVVLRYLPEPGVTLSGKVKQVFGNKPIAGVNVTLMAPDAKGNKIYFTKTDSAGSYYLDGLPLYGVQRVKLTAKNNKGKEGGLLTMDSVFNNRMPVTAAGPETVLPDTAAVVQRLSATLLQRKVIADKQNVPDVRDLEGVTVTNKKPKTLVLRDGAYISFGGPDSTFTITAADFKDYERLSNFLVHRMAGAMTDPDSDGVLFMANGQKIRPRFIVDKREDVFERLDFYQLTMDVIETVTVRHMLSAIGGGDVYLVYLSLKPEAYVRKELDLLNTSVSGYYEARTFYTPARYRQNNNVKDVRTTLYWNPAVVTGTPGTALSFPNADTKTSIRIVAEGVTNKGVPVCGVTTYQVK